MWNQERTLALIDDIKKNPCLWNPWHEDYKQKEKRIVAYEKLAKKYYTDPENIEKKIKALKNQFRRERRKVSNIAKDPGGSSAKQSFWFGYDRLSFLLPLYRNKAPTKGRPRNASNNKANNKKSADEEASLSPQSCKEENRIADSGIDYIPYIREISSSPQNDYDVTRNWPAEMDLKIPLLSNTPMPNFNSPRQEKYRNIDSEDEQNETTSKRYRSPQQNEYQQIAQVWANELQKMEKTQQAYAKKAINEILFEGQMGTLRRNTLIINSPQSATLPHSNGHMKGNRTRND